MANISYFVCKATGELAKFNLESNITTSVREFILFVEREKELGDADPHSRSHGVTRTYNSVQLGLQDFGYRQIHNSLQGGIFTLSIFGYAGKTQDPLKFDSMTWPNGVSIILELWFGDEFCYYIFCQDIFKMLTVLDKLKLMPLVTGMEATAQAE